MVLGATSNLKSAHAGCGSVPWSTNEWWHWGRFDVEGCITDGYGITTLHECLWLERIIGFTCSFRVADKRVKASHLKSDLWQEELDVDVELLNWEDCAQNLVSRVGMLKFRCKLRRRCEVWRLVQIDRLQDKVQENLKTLRIVLDQQIYVWWFFSERFCWFSHILFLDSPNRKVFFCWSFVIQVDKTWRQVSSQKYRSILDLLGKKAGWQLGTRLWVM